MEEKEALQMQIAHLLEKKAENQKMIDGYRKVLEDYLYANIEVDRRIKVLEVEIGKI